MKRSLSYKKHKKQRKTTKKNKSKKHGRNMKGGQFSQAQKDQLTNMGFTNDQQRDLAVIGITMNEIQDRYNALNENITPQDIAELITYRMINFDDWSNISSINGNTTITDYDDDDITFHSNDNTDNTDNTDIEELSFEEPSFEEPSFGGKKRKSKKNKKTRKQKGGMCYGTGVGANYNNPNYSIYNTELTQLFPYKPK
jgi:hypothetical protein